MNCKMRAEGVYLAMVLLDLRDPEVLADDNIFLQCRPDVFRVALGERPAEQYSSSEVRNPRHRPQNIHIAPQKCTVNPRYANRNSTSESPVRSRRTSYRIKRRLIFRARTPHAERLASKSKATIGRPYNKLNTSQTLSMVFPKISFVDHVMGSAPAIGEKAMNSNAFCQAKRR